MTSCSTWRGCSPRRSRALEQAAQSGADRQPGPAAPIGGAGQGKRRKALGATQPAAPSAHRDRTVRPAVPRRGGIGTGGMLASWFDDGVMPVKQGLCERLSRCGSCRVRTRLRPPHTPPIIHGICNFPEKGHGFGFLQTGRLRKGDQIFKLKAIAFSVQTHLDLQTRLLQQQGQSGARPIGCAPSMHRGPALLAHSAFQHTFAQILNRQPFSLSCSYLPSVRRNEKIRPKNARTSDMNSIQRPKRTVLQAPDRMLHHSWR